MQIITIKVYFLCCRKSVKIDKININSNCKGMHIILKIVHIPKIINNTAQPKKKYNNITINLIK